MVPVIMRCQLVDLSLFRDSVAEQRLRHYYFAAIFSMVAVIWLLCLALGKGRHVVTVVE